MWSEVKKFFFQDPTHKSTTRQILEIGLLYLILIGVVAYHDELRIRWVLISVVFLVTAVWSWGREFLRVALTAGIIVFGLVRPFVVQAFYIPSRSMENTLLVNDHIFVNKFIYRLSRPDRWDIVVFEYPEDPSKDYIKRLVGLPGDTITVRDHRLIVNGEPVPRRILGRELEIQFPRPPRVSGTLGSTRLYRFRAGGLTVNHRKLFGEGETVRLLAGVARLVREADHHRIKEFVENGVTRRTDYSKNFGPVRVPRQGDTVHLAELDPRERQFYYHLLRNRSSDPVRLQEGRLLVGDRTRRSLTVRRDLYFMMGDNRDHSEDSRVWGFVPEDRLLGEAFFIYWPPRRIGIPGGGR